MEKTKLLCFSHAGSSATIFYKWKKVFLEKGIEIIPVELPGRGSRIDESLCCDVDKLISDLFLTYKNIIERGKYAVFGHSMGSLILYEFCNYCIKQGISEPIHIFVSGRAAPHIPKKRKINHLNDEEFMEEVYKLGGCEEELINNAEIVNIFLPILRNDYSLVENYKIKNIENFSCGLTVLNGMEDTIINDDLQAWSLYTDSEFEILNFKGGHFYLFNYQERIAQIVADRIKMKSFFR